MTRKKKQKKKKTTTKKKDGDVPIHLKGIIIYEKVSLGMRIPKQEMLQYVANAPEGPLCATHLLIMLYLSVMFR